MGMQEAITEYYERGFNLIPLASNSKVPLAELDLDRYFTEKYPIDQLRELAAKQDINLGVITGKISNLAVIDVDSNNKDIQLGYLSQYPTELVSRTPKRDGRHLYYEYREKLPEILKIENGDFFAGSHYVVIPPSKIEGKAYEWLKHGNLGHLPDGLFGKMFEMQSGKYTRTQIWELINTGITDGMVEGQWNDTVLYGSMVFAGDGMSEEAIYAFMMNLNKGQRPIPARQVRSMVKRGVEYSLRNTYQKELPKGQVSVRDVELKVSSYASVAERYQNYEASWMVEGWMLDSAIVALAAPPERYKTWISVDLALSIASGLPFLDTYEVHKTGNVLILQQEDFGARYFARFKAVERAKLARAQLPVGIFTDENGVTVYTPNDYDITNKIFFHEDAELSLENDSSIDRLEQRIKETQAVLVIIDPFYSLGSTDDHFASIAQKIRERIKVVRNNTGAAFLFIHHNRKSGSSDSVDNLSRSNIFGSQFVSAVMEGTWVAGRTKGLGNTQIDVERRFKDEFSQPIARLNFLIDMKALLDDNAYKVEVREIVDDLLDQVKAFLIEEGAQIYSELYSQFGARFASRSGFSRWLKDQLGNGIRQDGMKGKYSIESDTD